MNTSSESVIIVGGGQSGIAAARAALNAGLKPVVLEAGTRPVGSWPHYYDSLRLFSPTRYSSFPGTALPGDPDAYPTRDQVVEYLAGFARTLDADIRTGTPVTSVEPDGHRFVVHTSDGHALPAAGVVAASGSFSRPYVPDLPGLQTFTGESLHVAEYRDPAPYRGKRVVVVGAGNSAIQVAYELAQVATVTVSSRAPVRFWDQRIDGRDIHEHLVGEGFDQLPPAWLAHLFAGTFVLDTGVYEDAFSSGLLDRRPLFTAVDGNEVVWADGARERADVILFATGYRPSLEYLRPLGALTSAGLPQHVGGISTTHPGLVYVGLEFQRSFSSNTLRGVQHDADYVLKPLAAHVNEAGGKVATHDRSARLSAV